jgi:hypothetical protein
MRFSNIGIMIGFIFLLLNVENIRKPILKFKILLFTFIFVFVCYSYAMRDDLRYGNQYYALFLPTYSFFTDLYPDEWVVRNLRSDGLFINTSMQY